jgi:hypothetical protein
MTLEEQEVMNTPCRRIAAEQDSRTFDELVHQLTDLLDKKGNRLESEPQRKGL